MFTKYEDIKEALLTKINDYTSNENRKLLYSVSGSRNDGREVMPGIYLSIFLITDETSVSYISYRTKIKKKDMTVNITGGSLSLPVYDNLEDLTKAAYVLVNHGAVRNVLNSVKDFERLSKIVEIIGE